MAKIISTEIESQKISSSYSLLKIAIIGALIGLSYWILTLIIGNFTNSLRVSSDIATILTAVMGIIVMIRLNMVQPLIIAAASGLTLWGLTLWTNGLTIGEVIIWDILLYSLAYVLFSWLARYTRITPVLITMLIIIIAMRIAVS